MTVRLFDRERKHDSWTHGNRSKQFRLRVRPRADITEISIIIQVSIVADAVVIQITSLTSIIRECVIDVEDAITIIVIIENAADSISIPEYAADLTGVTRGDSTFVAFTLKHRGGTLHDPFSEKLVEKQAFAELFSSPPLVIAGEAWPERFIAPAE